MIMNKDKAIQILKKAIDNMRGLDQSYYGSPPFEKFMRHTRLTICHVFGEMSQHIEEFNSVKFNPSSAGGLSEFRFKLDLQRVKALLSSMLEEVQDFWPDDEPASSELVVSPQDVLPVKTVNNHCVFIGHGHSKLWARLKIYVNDELGLNSITYESESRVGESIIPVLEKMLDQATFAVIVLTAEDETSEGLKRARQNVVHEAGLFQGRLGFKKVVAVRQEGLEDFTNVAGLQYIGFSSDRIENSFYELQRVLKREGLLS
jgi:hypothetical protein